MPIKTTSKEKRKMKIFILSDTNSIHTKRWVLALSEKGIEIFLFGLNKCESEFYNDIRNVTIFHANITNNLKNRTNVGSIEKLKYLSVIKVLKNKIKEFKPDILHAHYASSYGLLGSLTNFKPYIISIWGSDVYCFPKQSIVHKYLFKYVINKADILLSTSHCMANEIKKYTTKKIKITPFGIDTNQFKKMSIDENNNDIIIGNVKTLLFSYGIDTLIKAFHVVINNNMNKNNIYLYILGKGEHENYFRKLVRELNIEDKVKFLGFVENYKLPNYYNKFTMAVSLSNFESFGVVAIEAMSCECPVIVSDAPGFTETVLNNVTGYIVPKKDIEKTADAMQKLINNKELRNSMGAEGRKRVLELYNWEENVNQLLKIYNQTI